MARDDDETPWARQLLVAGGALLAVALVIGGVVSVVALGAAKVAGIDESRPKQTVRPSLYFPSGEPSTSLDPYPDPDGSPSPSGSASATPTPTRTARPISLQAFPQRVAPGGRINLTGVYQGGEGGRLQVQRYEDGAWTDFPVTANVRGGQFATYITTDRTGATRLRVVDARGRSSNAVRVRVGR